jgi:hypothetical protein
VQLQIETLIRNFNRKWIFFVLVPAIFAALACQEADQRGDSEGNGKKPPSRTPTQVESPSSPIPPVSLDVLGNVKFAITDYGDSLKDSKQALLAALRDAGATAAEQSLVMAIAMQETTLMTIGEIDRSKDNTPAANVSILNINIDMLQQLGYSAKDFGSPLNEPSELVVAVSYMIKGFRTWSVPRTLNFHRGGRTAFNDGSSFGASEYRNSIATIYAQIRKDPSLLEDGRRVEVDVPHV